MYDWKNDKYSPLNMSSGEYVVLREKKEKQEKQWREQRERQAVDDSLRDLF